MLTYQDLLAVGENDEERAQFVRTAIQRHKEGELYKTAKTANDYERHQNTTIREYKKWLYTVGGKKVLDTYGANYKLASNFFEIFITQENQHLLGNGVTWKNSATGEKLGKRFDFQLQKAGSSALSGGVSFGFWNNDHLEVFRILEFVPFYDEENGALRAGIRFWQIDENKPLRATLYEEDGYTDYIWNKREGENGGKAEGEGSGGEILNQKRPYKIKKRSSEAEGTEIYDGENYPVFPVVPLYGNRHHQSEIIGIREQIDAYDLIKSGACNNVEEASYVYWVITGAGGMDDMDHQRFIERMKLLHSVSLQEDQTATANTIEAPVESRETLLKRIRADLFENAMALDIKEISSGAATATEIRAAYELLTAKCDQYEYCVLDFLDGILAVAGIDDEASFTRSYLINQQEDIQTIVQAASYLDEEYVTTKILQTLGDGDQAEEVLRRMAADELERGEVTTDEAGESGDEEKRVDSDGEQ